MTELRMPSRRIARHAAILRWANARGLQTFNASCSSRRALLTGAAGEKRNLKGGQTRRRLAHVGRLLVSVGTTQQLVFAPGTARKGDAKRIVRRVLVAGARDETCGHHDAGIARLGRYHAAAAAGEQHRVELVLV